MLVQVLILSLLHPRQALVDGVEAVPGHRYGGERFTVQIGDLRRTYAGSLEVEAGPDELRLINDVDLEDYVASVVAAELGDAPPAARQALAIVARTYALATPNLDDTARNQWYRGLDRADIESAKATQGQVLTLHGKIVPVFHSQDCGGWTRTSWHSTERTPDTHPSGLARGSGHGVGLCQRGAMFMASKGATAHQILARYFPGLHIGRR